MINAIEGITVTAVTEFEYDGQDRRRRIVERVSGVEQSNETYLWADGAIVQKRNSASDTVLRDYYWFGFSAGARDYFYTRDHLGSVREVIASNGTTIESRYDYDLWGNVTRTAGTGVESDFLYTGHFYHAGSDLHLAQYRAYDSELGRWLSRDPMDFVVGLDPLIFQGPNLYQYAYNNPARYVDDNGLWIWHAVGAIVGGALDLTAQLVSNGGNIGDVDWGSVAVSSASGALGVGLGTTVARQTTSIAGRAALNGLGSAGIGAGGQMANNAMDPCSDIMDGVGDAAILSGAFGAIGSAGGDLAERGFLSITRETPLIEGLQSSGTLIGTTPRESVGSSIGTGVGIGISNASSAID